MNHIVPIVDFRNPDYLNNLFLSAIEDEKRSGEKFAAYCEGCHKNKLSVESISFLLISSGKFKTEPTARKNARKILLLGGSILNRGILEDLRTGKISFERALWSVKDPRGKVKEKRISPLPEVKKSDAEILNNAASMIIKGLFLYWKVKRKDSVNTKEWVNQIIEYHISGKV